MDEVVNLTSEEAIFPSESSTSTFEESLLKVSDTTSEPLKKLQKKKLQKETEGKDKVGPENRYSCKERVRMVQLYAENLNNPRRVQRIFQSEFKKKPPATRTITKLYKKFQETGSVQNNYSKIRPRKSRTKENVEKVKLAFQKSPTKSIRKMAQELRIPHTTVGRILQELKGKEAGQIRRSRTLKIGLRTSNEKLQGRSSTAPPGNVNCACTSSTSSSTDALTVSSKGEMSNIHIQNFGGSSDLQSQTIEFPLTRPSHQGPAPLLTIQAQPLVSTTVRSQPSSIFIVETSPRELLSNLFFCFDFACRKHSTQRRKDPQQSPYINHPIGVANILINEGQVCDPDILQAAVLHDTLEDTDTTVEELRTHFGTKVTAIVEELTDDKTLSKEMRKLLQIQNGSKKSYGAQLVGMADKIHNLRELTRVSPAVSGTSKCQLPNQELFSIVLFGETPTLSGIKLKVKCHCDNWKFWPWVQFWRN
ncbi:unnamed protein product [Allacma fusca]|uniref:Guanosine-3',5'-bis(diphosphate) 3'-pyrophosphohydrolase MESH1 n=1 Tax=Allacma fusca TaxID=39272 RepID=A0A8J2P6F8_9HEXA|nr:unnamed protein product [Allacma fusca]